MRHAYKIVLFPDDVENKLSVDVVPSTWIFESEKHESKMCHFPVGPFTAKSIAHLHKMVKNRDSADKSWPVHRVLINGRAHTYAEACKAADKLHYDHFAFSTDRESSVERIFTQENRLSISKKPTKQSVQEELNDASFDMASVNADQNKENESNSRAKTSSENSGSSPGKERVTTTDSSSGESPRQPKRKSVNRKKRNFNPESRSFKTKPTEKERPAQFQPSENSKKRSYSSSSDCSPTSTSSTTSVTTRNTKRRRLSPSTDIAPQNSSRSNSTSPLPPPNRTSIDTRRRSRSTEKTSANCKNDPLSLSRTIKRRSFSADMSRKDTEKMNDASPALQRSQSIGDQSIEEQEEREEDYSLANVVKMLRRVHASLSSKIDRTYGKTVELTGRINEMKVHSHQQVPDAEEFDVIEPIQLPIDTKENFNLFDTKILEDAGYRQRIKNRVKYMIPKDRTYDTHHLSTILRIYLKKELVLATFTSVRAKNEKIPLKDTNFYKCLLSVHMRLLGETMSEQKFKVHLKASLNSAKDWDGGRAFRRG
ncbi:uncharacterized protein [Fopius arisanus]|uniref:DUF4806 domain-containing protein n=3 Tax=Fopius arisanus TaxID=64838 RepID=A0A9R1SWG7_9HYME|nr:PREDICTED: uncharacterized protein LOC105263717 [Fopius arisanus]XP_011298409.1 PREDICTED: uncharacterized protein LOC105263717 [Fopius arisanus]